MGQENWQWRSSSFTLPVHKSLPCAETDHWSVLLSIIYTDWLWLPRVPALPKDAREQTPGAVPLSYGHREDLGHVLFCISGPSHLDNTLSLFSLPFPTVAACRELPRVQYVPPFQFHFAVMFPSLLV